MTSPPLVHPAADGRAAPALLEALVAQAPLSVVVYDADGRVVLANPAGERLFGIGVADLPAGYSLWTDAQVREAGVLPHLRAALAGAPQVLPPGPYDAARLTGGAGRAIWGQAHAFPVHALPVHDGGGRVAYLAVVTVDVTAWAETETQLRATTAALEEQAAALRATGAELARRTDEAERAGERAADERAALDRILAQLPAAVAVYEGPALRVRAMSAAYQRIIGGRDVLGLPIRAALPELEGQGFFERLERVYATGEPYVGTAVPARWDDNGDGVPEDHVIDLTYAPLCGRDGRPEGVVALVTDVGERTRLAAAERLAAERARRLQALTARLNEAASREQIAHVIFEGALEAVAADAGALSLVHPDADGRPAEFEVVRTAGYAAALAARYRRFPVVPGRPLSEAVTRRVAIFVGSVAEWRARYPATSEELAGLGFAAFVAIPVAVGERVLAALTFSFRAARDFDEATRTFLATIGEQCALALERQRLHEAELRHAERQAALLATIQDGFVAVDRDLRYTYANARAEAVLGRPARELLGRRIVEVFPTVVTSPLYAAIETVRATREAREIEARSATLGRWIEARIFPAPDDGVTIAFQDVSARRRAQDAATFTAEASALLATSLDYEATLRAVADAAVPRLGDWCAVDIVADPTAGTWPPVVERLAMVHRDPAMLALGEAFARRYPTDWSAPGGMAAVLREKTPFFLPEVTDAMVEAGARDAEHRRMLRALRFSSIIVVPLVARGLTLGALTLCTTESGRRYDDADLALAQDLAQRAAAAIDNARLYREAERQRADAEAARAAAEHANRAKSQFLATMSHELRTPLNAIGGYAELLALGIRGDVTAEQREDLARIQRSQQHLLGLINEVLNYARLEAGTVRYDLRAVPVGETLADLEALVRPQVAARGLTLALAAVPPAVRAMADVEKLRQVLLNLLSNAIKFTERGGRIAVTATPCHDAAGHDAVTIAVTDTGVGIAPAQQAQVFEPFVQVGRSLNSPGEGTGLGLAISRDLARGMGGDLTVESAPGVGSTFTLVLPAADDDTPPA